MTAALVRILFAYSRYGPLIALLLLNSHFTALFSQVINFLIFQFVFRHIGDLDDSSSILYQTLNTVEAFLN